MTYAAGQIILDDEYNTFITGDPAFGVNNHLVPNVNTLYGTGAGNSGYGQTIDLFDVNPSITVAATQWATMLTDLGIMESHQGSSLSPMVPTPITGIEIEALTAIQGNITLLDTNKLNAVATGTPTVVIASDTNSWGTSSIHTITCDWTSPDALRYFFNAGGQIEVVMSRSGGSATAKNTEWTNLLNDCGTIIIHSDSAEKSGGAAPGVGEITNIALGYYQLDVSDLLIHRQFAGGVYSSNRVEVEARTNGQNLGGNNDNGDIITMTISMYDSAGDPPDVDGTTSVTISCRPPSSTFLSDTWGVPTLGTTVVQT